MAMQANFGESLKVVGSSEALGNWDVSRSPSMTWTDGDVWRLELALPPGEQIHFKVSIVPVRICEHFLGEVIRSALLSSFACNAVRED